MTLKDIVIQFLDDEYGNTHVALTRQILLADPDLEDNRQVSSGDSFPSERHIICVYKWWIATVEHLNSNPHVLLRSHKLLIRGVAQGTFRSDLVQRFVPETFGGWGTTLIYPSDPEFFSKLRSHLDLWIKATGKKVWSGSSTDVYKTIYNF